MLSPSTRETTPRVKEVVWKHKLFMTRVNQPPEVLYIWKKQQRSSEDEDEGSIALLTHKNWLAGKYSLILLGSEYVRREYDCLVTIYKYMK